MRLTNTKTWPGTEPSGLPKLTLAGGSMGSASSRPGAAPSLQMYLYRRPLHPESLQLKGRSAIKHGAYQLESWVMPAGHVLRFEFGGFACCEALVSHDDRLPVEGAVTALPCTGEHDFTHSFEAEKVKYLTSLQTETLSDNLYKTTYQDLIDLAKDTGAIIHTWTDDQGRKQLSMVETQRLAREVHAQAYHMIAQTGLVIRTQTIFEHR